METQGVHGQSASESARHGQSLISRAMAMSRMRSSTMAPSTATEQNRGATPDRCPRCGKTVDAPILLAHAKAEEYLIGLIKRDHPEWIEPGGTCPGCVAYYRVLVERTGV